MTGQLLGLDIEGRLEVTDCFPFLSRGDDDDDEDGAAYQVRWRVGGYSFVFWDFLFSLRVVLVVCASLYTKVFILKSCLYGQQCVGASVVIYLCFGLLV